MNICKKKISNALIICASVLISSKATATDLQPGDVIKLGTYPASRVESTDGLVTNRDYITEDYHYCYMRNQSSVYFLKKSRNYLLEPISFKIISNDGTKVTAVSTQIIDAVPYNDEYESVTYSDSSIKSYLETTFKSDAFSDNELAALKTIRIPTADETQSSVMDKIATATDYLETKYMLFTPGQADCWWVQGETAAYKSPFVSASGELISDGAFVDAEYIGVRPVIEFNLNRVSEIDEDGKVIFKNGAQIFVEGNDVTLWADDDIDETVLFVAVYDDNSLSDVKTRTIKVRDGDVVKLDDFYNFTAERRLIKVMWLESMDTLKPVCASFVVDRSEYGINVINYINQESGITVHGNISMDALGINADVSQSVPWLPAEITLCVYDDSDTLVYYDQTTADDNGDYFFNFNHFGYTGRELNVNVNNTYGALAEATLICEN